MMIVFDTYMYIVNIICLILSAALSALLIRYISTRHASSLFRHVLYTSISIDICICRQQLKKNKDKIAARLVFDLLRFITIKRESNPEIYVYADVACWWIKQKCRPLTFSFFFPVYPYPSNETINGDKRHSFYSVIFFWVIKAWRLMLRNLNFKAIVQLQNRNLLSNGFTVIDRRIVEVIFI